MNSGLPSVRACTSAGERGGKAWLGKLDGQVALDVLARQELERQLSQNAARLQVAADLQERVLVDAPSRTVDTCEQQHAHALEAPAQVVQQIDRGDVRPMEVVEEHDQRPDARDLLEQRGQLALDALLRRAAHVGPSCSTVEPSGDSRRDVEVPGRARSLSSAPRTTRRCADAAGSRAPRAPGGRLPSPPAAPTSVHARRTAGVG